MFFTILNTIITVLSLVIFLGVLYWAYARQNKERFEERTGTGDNLKDAASVRCVARQ